MLLPIFVPTTNLMFTPEDLINTIKTVIGLQYPFKIIHVDTIPDDPLPLMQTLGQMTAQQIHMWDFDTQEYYSVDSHVLVVIKYWTPETPLELKLKYSI